MKKKLYIKLNYGNSTGYIICRPKTAMGIIQSEIERCEKYKTNIQWTFKSEWLTQDEYDELSRILILQIS